MKKLFEIVLLFTLLVGAIVYSGCFLQQERMMKSENLSFYDDSGISSSIRNYFGESMGQVMSVENHTASTAEAIVSITKPKPDIAKVWLSRSSDGWEIDRVIKQYVVE